MNETTVLTYAQINARILPEVNGAFYKEPLRDALEENGFGAVTGAFTKRTEDGEIEYCGMDVEIFNLEEGVPFICDFLNQRGAPKGSKLQIQFDDEQIEVEFGVMEGLAIYFNSHDLPGDVYDNYDLNDVCDEINELLRKRGMIHGNWEGQAESAIYLYGHSAQQMRELISPIMESNPLCDKARYVTIA